MRSGFTLIELIVVVIVIGILTSFVVPQFAVTKERALDREAISVLGLIWAAERAYRMEEGVYYTSASIPTLNTELRLNIPASSSWNYSVSIAGINCFIRAVRIGGPRVRTLEVNARNSFDTLTCCCGPTRCFF